MRIAVLGAGAMGSLYGGFLAESGENQVTLIDIWKEHIDAVNTKGLIIENNNASKVITNLCGVYSTADAEPADLIIVFVKATHTEEAIRQAVNLVKSETMVLTLQNGLGNVEKLCSILPAKHVIAGITGFGASIKGPGRIHQGGSGDTVVGEIDGSKSERLEKLKTVFDQANLSVVISNRVISLIWTKLMANIGINALATLTSLKNGQLLEHRETEALLAAAVSEAALVAKAKGIELETPDAVEHTRVLAQKTGLNTCSMLQDVLAKRLTEIDFINGAVVDYGKQIGVPTPVNWVLSSLIKTIQSTYQK
jgi:2-dehydropantoate 2-reductase